MPKRLLFLITAIIGLFIFVGFSYLVHKNHFTTIDFTTTVRLQDHISQGLNGPFSLLSEIGKFEVMTVVLAAIFLLARRFKAGIIAFAFYVGFHLIEIYGKYFVHHPPPPQFMVRTFNLIPLSPFDIRTQNSYPSGHAARAMFISVISLTLLWQTNRLSFPVKAIATLAILGYDILLLISRVYLGEHWFSDVIGGIILGATFGLFAASFITPKEQQLAHKKTEETGLFPKYKMEIKRVT
ncbi:MAG: phosphatase PAP2 family protein [Candidatus Levyibacteriota bacterium]